MPRNPAEAGPDFPRCGKQFSMAWKKRRNFFHDVENPEKFPTAWKTRVDEE
jgi:hypothetical protein